MISLGLKSPLSSIRTLPNLTIYSAFCFAQNLCEQHGIGACPVMFDHPLYIKAAEIVASSPDLSLIFVRL